MTQEETESPDVIPESLLAFAKDKRYIRQCQELLQQVFLHSNAVDSTDLWWWSALLHATLVVGRKERTLGMEFVGLQHTKLTLLQQRVGRFLLMAGWALWLRRFLRLERSHIQEQRHDQLRGEARQYFYEQQRRAMLQRASRTTDTTSDRPLNISSTDTEARRQASCDLMGRMKQLLMNIAQIMSEAISSSSDNPHSLPDTTALLSIGRWILRLHVAHYCITGRYPTWWHRLLNVSVKRETESSRISNPPPTTYPLVGRLIFIQAGATLAQALARWIASYMACKRIEAQEESESQNVGSSNVTLQEQCGICRMPRRHSASSVSCGHVFCWKCLYQWVSTVRPECPLCRSGCRPQDILALHNY